MDHFRELKIQKELNWDKVRPLLVLFWLMGKKLPGFGIQTKQDSSVFLIICILSKLGKKSQATNSAKVCIWIFFCRHGVMKDASPAIPSLFSQCCGWYCGTRLHKVFGIAVPGFTRYLFGIAVPGFRWYLVMRYQALQGIWYCSTRLYKVFGIAVQYQVSQGIL